MSPLIVHLEDVVPQWVKVCTEFGLTAHEYLKMIISEPQSKFFLKILTTKLKVPYKSL